MNLEERKEFISSLMGTVEEKLLEDAEQMPDEWDGIELRRLIKDRFDNQVVRMSLNRWQAYQSSLLARGL